MGKNDLPFWRLYLVPAAATLVAGWFWISYYGSVRWWPAVLLCTLLANYAWYASRTKSRS